MLRRTALLAVVTILAWGAAPAESRPQQDDVQMNLTCKVPSFKIKQPELFLNGSAALSDGIFLRFHLFRSFETLVGPQLQPAVEAIGQRTLEINGKKFVFDTVITGPGKMVARIELNEDMQEKQHAAEAKKKAAARRDWSFEFLVWGDELVPLVGNKLTELQALIQETKDILKKFEKAIGSEQTWTAEKKPLVLEGNKFLNKVEGHELKAFFPATVMALQYTLRNVVNSAPYYLFDAQGKFAGAKDYHTDGKKVLTYRGEEFNWENVRRYLEEAGAFGGREFCLWVVKDLRRTAGQVRGEVTEALSKHKAAPGVDLFWERLSKAGPSDIDALEAEVRGTKASAKQ